ncbi:hypothetical protein LENED_004640 [Lentinula edodes]|uniref:Uncharacterized protein n=1 Tax=Lentinula edodes TaxID=5353 RepID=A0A1Q3E7E5_LENED|nr:hypothetical protein LENED_004640 [Lentinula edodes]
MFKIPSLMHRILYFDHLCVPDLHIVICLLATPHCIMHLKFLTLGLAACVTNAIPVANTADNISTSNITNGSLVSGGKPTIHWSFDNVAKAKNDDSQHELENLINALLQDFGLPERIPDSAEFMSPA